MTPSSGESCAPGDLPERLATEMLPAGARLWRSHHHDLDPWHLSRGSPVNRFDDPSACYGVCYTARTPTGAFAETFLRRPKGQFVAEYELEARWLASLTFKRSLCLVRLYGPGLTRNYQTAAVTTGPVATAQALSAALYRHPDVPDGIVYRVRHDDDQLGVALFDRCPEPDRRRAGPWRRHPELARLCGRYDLIL